MTKSVALIFFFVYMISGCSDGKRDVKEVPVYPELFPDYQFVTIPVNIAPLNFEIKGADRMEVEFRKKEELLLLCKGDGSINIPVKKWHRMLEQVKGDSLSVKVFVRSNGVWSGYKPFTIIVVADPVDPYIAYRLIEPGYELWGKMGIYQRDITGFDEEPIVLNEPIDKGCVNCHSFHNYSGEHFMFHARMKNGGTIIVENEVIKKVDLKTARTISSGVYPMWHPEGRYIVFSVNDTHQAFHALLDKKIEVYDLKSDLIIYDVQENRVLTDTLFTATDDFETFPAWSPDGKSLYFCRAKAKKMPAEYKELKYGIYRVGFDPQTGRCDRKIDTIAEPQRTGKSVLFPRISPDGRYLLYTEVNSGTFPIWHKDADLAMINLETGEKADLSVLNSDESESYHSWSSDGRWIVFSSRRIDGLYTRLFFSYCDRNGKVHKPFLLPQKDPGFYELFLKSYNIPEFVKEKITVTPRQLEEAIKGQAITISGD